MNTIIGVGRVCFVIFIVYLGIITIYETIEFWRYLGFIWGVVAFVTGFFTIALLCYIVALLETIYDRTGRHDRLFDAQMSEITRTRKELEKGLQSIEEIKDVQRTCKNDRLFEAQLAEITRIGKELEKGLQVVEGITGQNFQSTPQAELVDSDNNSQQNASQAAETASSSSWSTGIKHS